MTRSHVLILATAAFTLSAANVFAQQPATSPSSPATSGAATGAPAANPAANPVVSGDRSTISGDKAATTDQKTEQQ